MNYQIWRCVHEAFNWVRHTLLACFQACLVPASASLNVLCSSHTMTPLLHHLLIGFLFLLIPVSAYIPASPTNDTNLAIQDGLNVTDVSRVILQWYSVAG
jgi:hypothetical protein